MPSGPVARPGVTVCIPADGAEGRLIGLLESLARQTYPNVTVRISLDWAPDHALPALPEMRGLRVDVIRQAQPAGWAANVNALLHSVETPYFALVMQREQLTPEFLAAAIDILERRPEVASVHGSAVQAIGAISGPRIERIRRFLLGEPRNAGMAWHGVVRSSLLRDGLRARTHRSDGMFSQDLFELEILIHGESVSLPVINDGKSTPDGQSFGGNGRSPTERAEAPADSLACLVDVLTENRLSGDTRVEILSMYAERLLRLETKWSDATFAEIRPAIARFIAHALWSANAARVQAESTAEGRSPAFENRPAKPRTLVRLRARVKLGLRRALMRLPYPVRRNPLFDADWYLARYPDVAATRTNPYRHYWRHGVAEARNPNELFDTDWYLTRYPDVRASGMPPLDHYLVFGAAEGRDPGPHFDTDRYLNEYPDVAASGLNPLEHYLRYGRAELRRVTDAAEPIARG